MSPNTMQIEDYEFRIESASFRYITDSSSGPGWDFSFHGVCADDTCDDMFPYDAVVRTEAAPLPLTKSGDYTGVEVSVPLPYDEDSGEPFFSLMVGEEHELSSLTLRFLQRDGDRYLIELEAEVAPTVLEHSAPLTLSAWTEEQPDHAYPA